LLAQIEGDPALLSQLNVAVTACGMSERRQKLSIEPAQGLSWSLVGRFITNLLGTHIERKFRHVHFRSLLRHVVILVHFIAVLNILRQVAGLVWLLIQEELARQLGSCHSRATHRWGSLHRKLDLGQIDIWHRISRRLGLV
jgi:hypothetical protein